MRFHIADPNPDESLSGIMPLSTRARSWLARVSYDIPEDESIQTVGAVTMLEGLDYHYSRFMDLVTSLGPYYSRFLGGAAGDSLDQPREFERRLFPTATETEDLNALDHEAVAYLNRLGQFHTYAKARGLAARLVKVHELMVFRNKHTAHRSIDAPRDESQQDREHQAMTFGFYRLTRSGFPTYHIVSRRKHREFQMRRDHPMIMKEAIDALFTLYPPPNGG
ncbi:MAG: hypothetical protein WCV99_07685 [Sterolibacterium sp.]|jgi:hypothetical protein